MNQLIPMQWPDEAEWQRPETLALLEGTPVNCILGPKISEPLAEAARARNIAVAAQPPDDVVILKDAVWPGPQRSSVSNVGTSGGPTGPPWIDANGWAISLSRAKRPHKTVWVSSKMPADRILRPEQYALAVADCAAYDARWVIALDSSVAKGLPGGNSEAKEVWTTLVRAVRFFEERRKQWLGYQPFARLGIVSSFEGENEFIGTEVLNLAARRHLAYRILSRPNLYLSGLAAVLWIEPKAPEGAEREALSEFVREGGILVVPASAAHMTDGLPAGPRHETGYKLFTSGKGHIAVAPAPWSDPYVLATDTHRILTRRHDPFRLWNATACNANVLVNGSRTLAHILNFTARPTGHPMSFWVGRQAASATFHDLYGRTEVLNIVSKNGGSEVSLPPVASYGLVTFGEKA